MRRPTSSASDPGEPRAGAAAGPDGRPLPQPLRQHRAPGRAGRPRDQLHGPQRPAVLRAGPHQGRAVLPPDRRQPARRAGLAAAAPALAGGRAGEGVGDLRRSWSGRRPARGAATARRRWRSCPTKSKGFYAGFVADVRKVQAVGARDRTRRGHRRDPPGGYPGRRPAPSTSAPTTGSPTSNSSASSPRGTPAWNG